MALLDDDLTLDPAAFESACAAIAETGPDFIGFGLNPVDDDSHRGYGAMKRSHLAKALGLYSEQIGAVTPSQTGGGPVMIWAMRRAGVPVPEAMIASFMSFAGTVLFFAIAGPVAIIFGAGRSLRAHGVPLVHLSLYDVFKGSAWGFVLIGALLLVVLLFPGQARRLLHGAVGWLERRGSARIAARVETLREGIDRMQECVVKFLKPAGWLPALGGLLTSALAHANKLLAGYVVLRALGIEVNFVDVLLLQITISFLLYFAPTPGGSGAAEGLAAALMSVYVPRALLPVYTLMWRFTVSYATVIFGSFVFFRLLRGRLEEGTTSEVTAA